MNILDERTAGGIFASISARERELSRNDYLLRLHPEDLEEREERYREKYGDLDDIKVIAKRLSLDKKEVKETIQRLLNAGLIRYDKATLDAYKPIAAQEGMKTEDYLEKDRQKPATKQPPKTFEIANDGLVNALFTTIREHGPDSLDLKFDQDTYEIKSVRYLPKKPSNAPEPVIADIKAHPYRVESIISFWTNFHSVTLLGEYTATKKPRMHTIREILLQFLVELKEFDTDITLLDNGQKIYRTDRDYTRYEYATTEKADEALKKLLADRGVNSLLRLADAIMDIGQAKMLRDLHLKNKHNCLNDALMWDAEFRIHKETITRVTFEDTKAAQEKAERTNEEYKAKNKNHYNYIPDAMRAKTWRYYQLLHCSENLPKSVWEKVETERKSPNDKEEQPYDYTEAK